FPPPSSAASRGSASGSRPTRSTAGIPLPSAARRTWPNASPRTPTRYRSLGGLGGLGHVRIRRDHLPDRHHGGQPASRPVVSVGVGGSMVARRGGLRRRLRQDTTTVPHIRVGMPVFARHAPLAV